MHNPYKAFFESSEWVGKYEVNNTKEFPVTFIHSVNNESYVKIFTWKNHDGEEKEIIYFMNNNNIDSINSLFKSNIFFDINKIIEPVIHYATKMRFLNNVVVPKDIKIEHFFHCAGNAIFLHKDITIVELEFHDLNFMNTSLNDFCFSGREIKAELYFKLIDNNMRSFINILLPLSTFHNITMDIDIKSLQDDKYLEEKIEKELKDAQDLIRNFYKDLIIKNYEVPAESAHLFNDDDFLFYSDIHGIQSI